MDTSNDNIRKLFDMLDNPAAYSEQEISDIINCDEEIRETYRLMVEAKRSSRWKHPHQSVDIDAAWQRFEQKHYTQQRPFHRWMHVAAIFIAAAFLCGLAYAAYHAIVPTKEEKVADEYADKKMFVPFYMPKEASEWHKKRFGDGICVYWCKGTWVINGDDSFVEEHPFCAWGYTFFEKNTTIRLDGKVLDINNLPDLPASALKKMEIHYNEDGHGMVHLSTKPVQIPANVKGNINPELTILLTGTPPAGNPMKTSIYVKNGTDNSFDWKNHYQGTSWEWEKEDISSYLKEVSYRKDHHVRINVCKDTPQKHIDRIKSIIQECDVTNYEIVRQ